jgi:hypothetical protein
MAWTVSYVATSTIRDALKNAIALNIGGGSPDTINVALFNNTIVPAHDTDPQAYAVAPWNANEVTGTNWSAGGVALASPAVTLVAGVGLMFDATDTSVASTTLTNAFGALIYDNTLSPKANIVAVWFGGTGYSTSNGTFGITWDALGIARIDMTP